jgi:3-demethylubiquinone-9 3-methyltransferase
MGRREPGSVFTVDFDIDRQRHTAINGGPEFTFSKAVSLLVNGAAVLMTMKQIDIALWQEAVTRSG